jgi:uncharacterized repeat protein (TIGR01451 family)
MQHPRKKWRTALTSLIIIGSMAISMAPGMAAFADGGGLTAKQIVETERTVKLSDGSEMIERVPAELVKPGDKIFYTLVYRNEGDSSAENIVLTMPVPPQITYLENTAAQQGADVVFSADGGKSFSPRGALRVTLDDEVRPAKSEEVTHIRWVVTKPILPGSEGRLSFAGILK